MVHPLAVYALEQADALQLAHDGCTVAHLLGLQDLHPAVVQHIGNALLGKVIKVRHSVVEVGIGGQPALIVAAQGAKSHSSFTSPERNWAQLESMFSRSILCISVLMSSPSSTLRRCP